MVANCYIDIPTMSVVGADYLVSRYLDYTSHSFNQFVLLDDTGEIRYLDHGDAYPREIYIPGVATLLHINGKTGDNVTNASVGGFEYSDTSYLAAINTVNGGHPDTYTPSSARNILIASANKTTRSVQLNFLTQYMAYMDVTVSTPQLVKVNNNRFLVLWSEDSVLKYQFVDGTGKSIGSTYTDKTKANLSDCQPIVVDNKVTWYVTNRSVPVFHSIDLNNPEKGIETYTLAS